MDYFSCGLVKKWVHSFVAFPWGLGGGHPTVRITIVHVIVDWLKLETSPSTFITSNPKSKTIAKFI